MNFQEENKSYRDQVRAIIDRVRIGPPSRFEKLCSALEETNQKHIVDKILKTGKVLLIVRRELLYCFLLGM